VFSSTRAAFHHKVEEAFSHNAKGDAELLCIKLRLESMWSRFKCGVLPF
jgi:hypothetical protein